MNNAIPMNIIPLWEMQPKSLADIRRTLQETLTSVAMKELNRLPQELVLNTLKPRDLGLKTWQTPFAEEGRIAWAGGSMQDRKYVCIYGWAWLEDYEGPQDIEIEIGGAIRGHTDLSRLYGAWARKVREILEELDKIRVKPMPAEGYYATAFFLPSNVYYRFLLTYPSSSKSGKLVPIGFSVTVRGRELAP